MVVHDLHPPAAAGDESSIASLRALGVGHRCRRPRRGSRCPDASASTAISRSLSRRPYYRDDQPAFSRQFKVLMHDFSDRDRDFVGSASRATGKTARRIPLPLPAKRSIWFAPGAVSLKRMIAGTSEVTTGGGSFLFAMGRADAASTCRGRSSSAVDGRAPGRSGSRIGRSTGRQQLSRPSPAIPSRSGPESGWSRPHDDQDPCEMSSLHDGSQQPVAGSRDSRSASFTSSYPAKRPNTD